MNIHPIICSILLMGSITIHGMQLAEHWMQQSFSKLVRARDHHGIRAMNATLLLQISHEYRLLQGKKANHSLYTSYLIHRGMLLANYPRAGHSLLDLEDYSSALAYTLERRAGLFPDYDDIFQQQIELHVNASVLVRSACEDMLE